MPAPLSIIIPAFNAAAGLPGTLASLMPGVQAGMIREVIVVDAGSTDDTAKIADGWGAKVIAAAPSRGGQLRAGADVAQGDWLLFLHADTHLPGDWADIVADHMTPASGAACFRLSFRAKGFGATWTAGWANVRTQMFGLPYGDQGLLISATDYAAIGGYPDQPLMEDVAMAKRLRSLTVLPATVTTGAEKYQAQGWFTRGTKNLWLLLRYKMGATPQKLAKAYQPKR